MVTYGTVWMNRLEVTVAAVVSLSILGAACWWLSDRPPASAVTGSRPAPDGAGLSGSDLATPIPAPASLPQQTTRLGTQPSWQGVATFGQLQKNLASGTSSRAQQLYDLKTASQLCEGYQSSLSDTAGKQSASTVQYERFAARFCKDFHGSVMQFESQLLDEETSDVVVAAAILDGANGSIAPGERAQAESIFLNSSDPAAVQLAAMALAGNQRSGAWGFGKDLPANSQERAALVNAQWLASRMLVCEMSGGCGPGGFFSVVECASYGTCKPGISALDVWRSVEPPTTYDLAQRLYNRAVQERAASRKGGSSG